METPRSRRLPLIAFSTALALVLAVPAAAKPGKASPPDVAQANIPSQAPPAQDSGGGDTGEEAGPPLDYKTNPGLSQPAYETKRESYMVPMYDGIEMYVEVVRPVDEGEFPVILELAPYHGTLLDRDGTRILPDPKVGGRSIGLSGYFAPRGYAVAFADMRGTGRSQGCLDHVGPKDAKDAKTIVEWLASRPWSNGRVGMAGHSYVGASQVLAAAQAPEGLATIVPSAGLASMYDHQFQAGVPYFLQWAGPQWSYEGIAMARHLPPQASLVTNFVFGQAGDNFGKDMEYFGCGWTESALTSPRDSQLSGEYTSWHGKRDWSDKGTKARIPIFLVHGVNDNAARIIAADWFFKRDFRRYGDKLWLGQWDHGSGCCPNRRGMQWTWALHAWFDRHLQQRDVDTGPPVEIFLADAPTLEPARTGARTEIFTSDHLSDTPPVLRLYPAADGTLKPSREEAAGQRSFIGDPRDGGGVFVRTDYASSTEQTGNATFVSDAATEDTLFVGLPEVDLVASVTAPRVHVIGTLYDQSPGGQRRRITTCTINPELRYGIAAPEPIIPLQKMDLEPPCFQMAHNLKAGHRLVFRVSASNADKLALFGADAQITVHTGPGGTEISLPVIEDPALYPDDLPLS